jgi:uncharacterized protein (TIGR03435 family)
MQNSRLPKALVLGAGTAFFCAVGGLAAAPSDQAAPKTEFEAASVKPSGPQKAGAGIFGKIIGGPGTADPIQLRGTRVTLLNLVRSAYDVPYDQISGPGWLRDELYDIVARVPKGSTKDQLKLMLQNLLADRFRLTFHREPKAFEVYVLSIGKGGSKLKPTAFPYAQPLRPGESPMPPDLDPDGFPILPPGKSGATASAAHGLMYWTFQSMPVSAFIANVQSGLGRETGLNTWTPGRVVDQTGLAAKYDFKVRYSGAGQIGDVLRPQATGLGTSGDSMLDIQDPGSGPDLFTAIEKQLGLKLTKDRSVLEVLVIDHAERIPIEN